MIHYTFYSVYNIYIHKILVPYHLLMISIWRFPKMEVPLTHLFISRIFHYKPTILGYPHVWKLPFEVLNPNNHYIYILFSVYIIYIYITLNPCIIYHLSTLWSPREFHMIFASPRHCGPSTVWLAGWARGAPWLGTSAFLGRKTWEKWVDNGLKYRICLFIFSNP